MVGVKRVTSKTALRLFTENTEPSRNASDGKNADRSAAFIFFETQRKTIPPEGVGATHRRAALAA